MVDALVSGASALRHVGSSPILGTINKSSQKAALIYCAQGGNYIYNPSKPPFKCTSILFVASARHSK